MCTHDVLGCSSKQISTWTLGRFFWPFYLGKKLELLELEVGIRLLPSYLEYLFSPCMAAECKWRKVMLPLTWLSLGTHTIPQIRKSWVSPTCAVIEKDYKPQVNPSLRGVHGVYSSVDRGEKWIEKGRGAD